MLGGIVTANYGAGNTRTRPNFGWRTDTPRECPKPPLTPKGWLGAFGRVPVGGGLGRRRHEGMVEQSQAQDGRAEPGTNAPRGNREPKNTPERQTGIDR